MNSDTTAWLEKLPVDEEIFPHQLDLIQNKVLLINLPKIERQEASFLDQRVFTSNTRGVWVPWESLADKAILSRNDGGTHFIFHVGHCGSTLLSRILAHQNEFESLREPLILRTLAQDLADSKDGRSFLSKSERLNRLKAVVDLWSRSQSKAIVKATSICTDLMPEVLSMNSKNRAIFIFNKLETHITTLLAGQNSLIDLRSFSQIRIQRLRNILGCNIQLENLSIGQLAALSWLSETTSAMYALNGFASKMLLVDFEDLLKLPEKSISRCFSFLGIPDNDAIYLSNLALTSSIMNTYSKAPEHHYNAETRKAILEQCRASSRDEIMKSVKWVEELASKYPLVQQSLEVCNLSKAYC